jgi:DNA-binding GntR family transcriptional regulator
MLAGLTVSRENLTSRVHSQLREALMAGRFWPGQRLRIREMALAMGVSDTPVREAVMQLVREGGLEMRSGQAINVVRLTLPRYLELREIRLLLEGLATEKATPLLTKATLGELEALHRQLIEAEKSEDFEAAVRTNFLFHFTIYRASAASDLVTLLEGLWLRNGPLLNLQYPHAPPTYAGRHQHLNVLAALRRRDPAAARQAIADDTLEGGKLLVELLRKLESGEAVIVETEDGKMRLEFPDPKPRERKPRLVTD